MSIKEVEKNKKYRIEVVIGYNGNKKIRHYETFVGGKKEALLRENEIKLQIKNNTYIRKNNMTIKELIEEWLKFKKRSIGIKTYTEYERECKNIIASIGHIKLKNINAKILEDFYNELKNAKGRGRTKKGYSDKTIKHHYTLVSEILNQAVKWDYISSNPNIKVDSIKVRKKEIECYSKKEVEELFEVLKKEPIKSLYCLLSPRSTRSIFSLSSMILSSRGNKWGGSERVFTTDLGADMHPHRPYKILQQIIEKYGLKKVTFHSLRHTSISLLGSLGVPIQHISRRAGHSSIAITNEVYTHIFEKDKKEIAYKMESLLNMKAI